MKIKNEVAANRTPRCFLLITRAFFIKENNEMKKRKTNENPPTKPNSLNSKKNML